MRLPRSSASRLSRWAGLTAALFLASLASGVPADDENGAGPAELGPEPVDFARQIRPILSENCFLCHGPDENDREAELRLDRPGDAFADRGGYAVLVPGERAASELYLRVADPDDPMPPHESELSLTAGEVELLGRWIDEGAVWEEHWAFVPPARPAPPAVRRADWPRADLDRFVLARLEAEGLEPAPEASRESWIRRVSLDLTGLPPSSEEVDAFLADRGSGAHGRVVDRLLASTRYGEAMARDWLDAARYGDTHGFHLDNERALWRWRDWVIDAFNRNLPFDQFTVEQLAGDLLPGATLDQEIATGFNRCNPTTGEGGLIAEEYLVKYAVDRVHTTATVWMGLTMSCAQCHDHKYDPVSQEEFYRFFAFFNSIDEVGSDQNALTPPPFVSAPTPEQTAELLVLRSQLEDVQQRLDAPMPAVDAAQAEWERAAAAPGGGGRWRVPEPLELASREGAELSVLPDGSLLASGANPDRDAYELLLHTDATGLTALQLEALTHPSLPQGGAGRGDNSNFVLTGIELEVAPAGRPAEYRPVPLAAAYADLSQKDFDVAGALDGDPGTGWAVEAKPEDRAAVFLAAEPFGFEGGTRLRVRLAFDSRFARHAIGRLRLSVADRTDLAPASLGPWSILGPFPAASRAEGFGTAYGPEEETGGVDLERAHGEEQLRWDTRPELADGAVHTLEGGVSATYLFRAIEAPDARTLELSLGSDDGLRIWLNGELVLDRDVARPVAADQDRLTVELRPGRNELLMKVVNYGGGYGFYFQRIGEAPGGLSPGLARILDRAPDERTADEAAQLRAHYRSRHSEEWAAVQGELEALQEKERALEEAAPRTMVMRERDEPRPAYVLERGRYDRKGKEVTPGVPAVLPPLPDAGGGRADRLALARWLVDGNHPLTARVVANRLWQRFFGRGLVETPEDFGTRGAWPSHPELLDWLAVELVDGGWDLKALCRTIALSATYRQSSRVGPELYHRDPANALLARGPRHRLPAEGIRDNALYLAGLLVEKLGGPSVRPYQPPGLWKVVGYTSSNTANFTRGSGEDLYRRSLYTFWKRTSPPPALTLLDAPSREACTVTRARTNTPLQALALMNDVQFVEAARALAERVLREGGATDEERAGWAFRLATARRPEPGELAVLLRLVEAQRAEYTSSGADAEALLGVGESAPDPELDPAELAAWTAAASLILNLDEVLTKG